MVSDFATIQNTLPVYLFYWMRADCYRKNGDYLICCEFYSSHRHRLSAAASSC
jgi:hypothetical protein